MSKPISGRARYTENDQGTWPATPGSPASSALDDEDSSALTLAGYSDEPGTFDIEDEFRRRLAGMRGLKRRERIAAYQAAKDWYSKALAEMREKRPRDRLAWLEQQRPQRKRRPDGPSGIH